MSSTLVIHDAQGYVLRTYTGSYGDAEGLAGAGETALLVDQPWVDVERSVVAAGALVVLAPRPSPWHSLNAAQARWDFDLEAARAAKWDEIKAMRDAVEYGGFSAGGLIYDSDEVSRGRITGAVSLALIAQSAGAPFSRRWTLKDNTSVELDAAGMIGVGVALGQHVGAAHDHAAALRELVTDAESYEDLQAIEW